MPLLYLPSKKTTWTDAANIASRVVVSLLFSYITNVFSILHSFPPQSFLRLFSLKCFTSSFLSSQQQVELLNGKTTQFHNHKIYEFMHRLPPPRQCVPDRHHDHHFWVRVFFQVHNFAILVEQDVHISVCAHIIKSQRKSSWLVNTVINLTTRCRELRL